MKKVMMPVEVRHEDGNVIIEQRDPLGNDDAMVVLTPDQIPLVVKWLGEAAVSATAEGE
jgi:hypothetical protein